jgi:hypothetical protein
MSTTKKGQKKLNKKKEKAKGEKRREGFCGVLVLEVEKVRLREVLAERERERLRFGLMGVVLSINPFYSRF